MKTKEKNQYFLPHIAVSFDQFPIKPGIRPESLVSEAHLRTTEPTV